MAISQHGVSEYVCPPNTMILIAGIPKEAVHYQNPHIRWHASSIGGVQAVISDAPQFPRAAHERRFNFNPKPVSRKLPVVSASLGPGRLCSKHDDVTTLPIERQIFCELAPYTLLSKCLPKRVRSCEPSSRDARGLVEVSPRR